MAEADGGLPKQQIAVDFRTLANDELRYELHLRGIPHEAVNEHQSLVALIYRHRMQDELTSRVQSLDPEQELNNLIPKLAELQSLALEAKRSESCCVQDTRLASLYLHVSYRLRRIQFRATGEVYRKLYEFARDLYTLHGLLSWLFPDVEFKRFPLPSEEIERLIAGTQDIRIHGRSGGNTGSASEKAGEEPGDARKIGRRNEEDHGQAIIRENPEVVSSSKRGNRSSVRSSVSDVREAYDHRREETHSENDSEERRVCRTSNQRILRADSDKESTEATSDRRREANGRRNRQELTQMSPPEKTEEEAGSTRKSHEKSYRRNKKKSTSRSYNREREKYRYGRNSRSSHRRYSSASSETSSENESFSSRKRVSNKKNLVPTWKLRFGGNEDRMRFLEEIEEQAGFHRISQADLLDGIGSLLTGNAKVWFRSYKYKLHTWDAFKITIKEAFIVGDDDDTILEKLKKLRQKNDESYMVFETRLDELVRRMTKPPDEDKRIKLLLDGMHSFYRERIRASEMKSLVQLRKECRSLERDKADLKRREKEEKRERNEKEDRGHKKIEHRKGFNVHSAEDLQVSSLPDALKSVIREEVREELKREDTREITVEETRMMRGAGPAVQCWRCGGFGHLSNKCTQKIFCSSCGAPDTIVERCQQCMSAAAQGLWRSQFTPPFRMGTWVWGLQVPASPPPFQPVMTQPPPV